ncbi:MAG TPA: hypothetical protein DIC19_01440 [Erysipelotrichaceae bacterium]|nr:hypothetical protein [Erysipelotrichaceae bacterium]
MRMRLKRKFKNTIYIASTLVFGWVITVSGISAMKHLNKLDAVEFRVEGETRFTLPADQADEVDLILKKYKLNYLSKSSIAPEAKILKVDFQQKIEIIPVKVDDEFTFNSIDDLTADLSRNEVEADWYTIVSGDNLWQIAMDRTDVTLTTIQDYNPLLDLNAIIYPGKEILLKPADPVYDVEVHLENIALEPVEFDTIRIKDESLLTSQRVILKEGIEGEKKVVYDITIVNGYPTEVLAIQETVLKQPVSAEVKVGTKRTVGRSGGNNYGVVSGRLSSNYGYRTHPISGRRIFHNGIDLAAPTGTAVYAYADGKVTSVSQDNTLGKYITIDHGGGLKTRYLHLSAYKVSVGDKVTAGQRIGSVGNTGYSTGSHLHFEVLKNGSYVSPWNYI